MTERESESSADQPDEPGLREGEPAPRSSREPILFRWQHTIALLALIATATIAFNSCDQESGESPISRTTAPTTSALTSASGETTESITTTTTTTATTTSETTSTGTTTPPPETETFLASLDPVNNDSWFYEPDLSIDGITYFRGLRSGVMGGCFSSFVGPIQTVEYSIDRAYDQFSTTVGVSDTSDAGLPILVEIFADGSRLWGGSVEVGRPIDVEVRVSGLLRLVIKATQQFDTEAGCVLGALGDPTLR